MIVRITTWQINLFSGHGQFFSSVVRIPLLQQHCLKLRHTRQRSSLHCWQEKQSWHGCFLELPRGSSGTYTLPFNPGTDTNAMLAPNRGTLKLFVDTHHYHHVYTFDNPVRIKMPDNNLSILLNRYNPCCWYSSANITFDRDNLMIPQCRNRFICIYLN